MLTWKMQFLDAFGSIERHIEALCLLRGVAFDMGAAGGSGKIGSGGVGRDSIVISSY